MSVLVVRSWGSAFGRGELAFCVCVCVCVKGREGGARRG